MRTRSLGKTGLDVSELCMGCWEIGHGEGLPAAYVRIGAHYPPLLGKSESEVRMADFTLCNAQLVVAREYGFESWRKMVATVFPARTPHKRQACTCCDRGKEDPTRVFLRVSYGVWLCRDCAAACRTVHEGGHGC